jgi:hypothetical protein
VSILATIGGGILLLASAASAWSTRGFIDRATRAEGVVVSLHAGSAHPEVEFKLPSGKNLSFPAGGFISYNKGDRARVLYLPAAPIESVRLDDFGELWLPDIASALLGAVIVFLGLNELRRSKNALPVPRA